MIQMLMRSAKFGLAAALFAAVSMGVGCEDAKTASCPNCKPGQMCAACAAKAGASAASKTECKDCKPGQMCAACAAKKAAQTK